MSIAAVILLLALASTRGLLGTLVGAFIGTLAAAGVVNATTHGELASMYTPFELAAGVVPVALVAHVLAFVAPYITGSTALAWAVGSVLAAIAAPRTGQAIYVAPLVLNALVAGTVVGAALRRAEPDGRRA